MFNLLTFAKEKREIKMTLKEEFEEKFLGGRKIENDGDAKQMFDVLAWIEQQIKLACDKQKEICARAYLNERGYNETANSIIANVIRNAPYPEGVKK